LLRQAALGQAAAAPKMHRALEVIDRQSDKLTRLIAQLLDVSRLQSGTLALERRPTDLAGMVTGIVAAAQQTTTIPLVVHAPGPALAAVDPLRVEQVVVNLVDNAIKYTVDDAPVEIAVLQPRADVVQVAVRDRGLGIPEMDRRHVFERFYQVGGSRQVGGMGLGLHISRQIVTAHGGTIELEVPPDGGSRFVVTLPAWQAGASTPEALTPEAPQPDIPSPGASAPDARDADAPDARARSARPGGHDRTDTPAGGAASSADALVA
jgi:signal transduction histidine kinase